MAGEVQQATVEELGERFRAARDVVERSHCQVVWLLAKGHSTAEVAEIVALSPRWVNKLARRYEAEGVAALGDRRRGNVGARPLLSGEDLTCQAGLAVQQDTLLAASLGVRHIERNGHHYVDGFGSAPAEEAQAFASAHAGFYDNGGGRPRLAVREGRLDLRSLHTPGFASAAAPLWHSLKAID